MVGNGEAAAQSSVVRRVVDADELEAGNSELASSQVEANSTASTGDFVLGAVVEAVDGGRTEAAADRGVGNAGACANGFRQAARLQQRTVSGCSAGSTRTSQFNVKGDAHSLVGNQSATGAVAKETLIRSSLNVVRLNRGDFQIGHLNGITTAYRRRISAVS